MLLAPTEPSLTLPLLQVDAKLHVPRWIVDRSTSEFMFLTINCLAAHAKSFRPGGKNRHRLEARADVYDYIESRVGELGLQSDFRKGHFALAAAGGGSAGGAAAEAAEADVPPEAALLEALKAESAGSQPAASPRSKLRLVLRLGCAAAAWTAESWAPRFWPTPAGAVCALAIAAAASPGRADRLTVGSFLARLASSALASCALMLYAVWSVRAAVDSPCALGGDLLDSACVAQGALQAFTRGAVVLWAVRAAGRPLS